MYQMWADAFTEMNVEFVEFVESVDAFAGEVRISMRHTGTMQTPNGPLPATGRQVSLESCDVGRVRDGKIVSFHSYFDQLALMAQLGRMAVPAQEAVGA